MSPIASPNWKAFFFLFLFFWVFTPNAVSALWLDGPNPVRAVDNGTFFAAVSIHSSSDGSDIQTVTLTGIENCFEVKSTDHECLLHIPGGEFFTEGFNMWLEDSELPGRVFFRVEDCNGLILDFEVEVLPHDETPVDLVSWERVKALYR